ncbi:MAG: family 20 glycosylhydrolase [Planctomycetota bacterium]
MPFIGWSMDVAREQSPSEARLRDVLARSRTAGYNAVALYLEHRFAYPSAPWAAGAGCLTPAVVRRLATDARSQSLRLVPFLNTLGHMEGFIRSAGGAWLAEGRGRFGGVQMCATRPECVAFARGLVADVLGAFDDEWMHLGGDETRQLGQCPACAERVAAVGAGGLYAEYFAPLCRFVLERGRRPCLWGDMLLQHPGALDAIPRQTVIFDWQYFKRPRESTAVFRQRGFDVVCCPSLQTYNAGWCFLPASQQNIDDHAADARAAGALGVCVTTWELCWFTAYATIWPLIYAAGRRLAHGMPWAEALATEGGPGYAAAAEIVGERIPQLSEFLRPGTWRSLRRHLAMSLDPFALWRAWRTEVCGQVGDELLRLCDEADTHLPDDNPLHWAINLHRVAVRWVRAVEQAAGAYAVGDLSSCVCHLREGADWLARLRPGLERVAADGGSSADVPRLDRLIGEVMRVCQRLEGLPAAGHRPAFETLVHDAYIPGDQAAWCTSPDVH